MSGTANGSERDPAQPAGEQSPPQIFRPDAAQPATQRFTADEPVTARTPEPTQAHTDYLEQAARHFGGSQSSAAQQLPGVPQESPPPGPQWHGHRGPAPAKRHFPGGSAVVVAAAILGLLFLMRSVLTSVHTALLFTFLDAVVIGGYLVFRDRAPQRAADVEARLLRIAQNLLAKMTRGRTQRPSAGTNYQGYGYEPGQSAEIGYPAYRPENNQQYPEADDRRGWS